MHGEGRTEGEPWEGVTVLPVSLGNIGFSVDESRNYD